jgi:hypothetical protein
MLILMTLAHLPTQAQVVTNQQVGFISEAEGLTFLSAFLTGRIFGHMANEFGFPTVIKRLWARALRLYGYHLFLLGIAFTVVATMAIHTKRPSLEGLLDFYLAHPIHAVCSAVLLVTARLCWTFCRCTSSSCRPHLLRCMWAAVGAGIWFSFQVA